MKLVRSEKRLGLIVARLLGAEHATGEVVIFLDAHCGSSAFNASLLLFCLEASRGWIEPILQRIKDDPSVFVCPVIDFIDAETLRYDTGSAGGVGTFWWSLHYKMDPIPPRELKRRKNPAVDPLRVCFYLCLCCVS